MRYIKLFEAWSRILPFNDWISEALTFPDGWQELPEWKLLRLMGIDVINFNDKTGTITLNNPYGGKNLRLTTSGYVRSSKQGHLFHTKEKDPMLSMLKYVIDRFAKKAMPLIPESDLDSLIVKHPHLINYLYFFPQIKKGVTKRIGIDDSSEILNSQHGIAPEMVRWLDKCSNRNWELDQNTGEINVNGNFKCQPGNTLGFRGVRFGVIKGSFICDNIGLTTLEGSPRKVEGDFSCKRNYLTSLQGSPAIVGGSFDCSVNKLTSLVGAPRKVGVNFECEYNLLQNLEGAPEEVPNLFKCTDNPLETILPFPKSIGHVFDCDGFRVERNKDGKFDWEKILTGKKFDGWIRKFDKAAKFLIPIVTPEQIAKAIEDDIKFIKFVPRDKYREIASILGYTEEEMESIAISVDMGII